MTVLTLAMLAESDTRFYISASTVDGAGEGVFASVPLRTGDRLRVVGVLVDRDSAADRCTAYADAYKIRVGNALLIPAGWAAKVNHHDDPNTEKVIDGGEVFLEVIRPVETGDEIFFRYHEYAASRFHGGGTSARRRDRVLPTVAGLRTGLRTMAPWPRS